MAKLPKGLTLEIDNVSQEIDLGKWTGVDLSEAPDLKLRMGQAVIDYMNKRISKGRGLGDEEFNPNKYSKSYRDSLEFKAAGKKPSPVNFKLSGDMLGSMDVDDLDDSKINIFIDPDQSPKAHGHMTGQEGKGPLPKRQFFGVTEDEFKSNILPKFQKDLKKVSTSSDNADIIAAVRSAKNFLSGEIVLKTKK